ncbi:hypothetical protein BJ165DRAFT_1533487 [Panaeolus papilionaceus]|nr:hypothetical protein BJ165DRAFT_1533487 [Panaeolus papilionaceus]
MSTNTKNKGTLPVYAVHPKDTRLPDRPAIPEHPNYDLYTTNLTKIVEAIHKQNPVVNKVATVLQEVVASTSASASALTRSKPNPVLPPASDAGSRTSRVSSPLSHKSPTAFARAIPIPASPPASDAGSRTSHISLPLSQKSLKLKGTASAAKATDTLSRATESASNALHQLLKKYDNGLALFALDVTVNNILRAPDEESRKKALEDIVADEDLPPMYNQVVMIMRNPSEPPPLFESASQYQNHAQTNQESSPQVHSPEEGGVTIPLQPPFTHAPPNGTMPEMLSSRSETQLTTGARSMQGIFASYRHGTITTPASKKQPFNQGRSHFMVYISFSTRSITHGDVQTASPARHNEFGAIFIHVVLDGERNVEQTICFNVTLQVPGIGRTSPRNICAILVKSDIQISNMNPTCFIAERVIGPATFNPSINKGI